MNSNIILKKQALSYLRKNNWTTAIGGFFVMLLPTILVFLLLASVTSFFNFDNPGIIDETGILFSEIVSLIILFLSTPIITGYLKLCYNISKGNNAEISDVFYFFSKKNYTKALAVNLIVFGLMLLMFLAFILPSFVFALMYEALKAKIYLVLSSALLVVAVVAFIFGSTRFIIIPCVLFEDESLDVSTIIRYGLGYAKTKQKETYTLLLTFFPYFLLCFFVVPCIFVVPYLMVTLMTHGKWITALYINDKNNI